MKRKRIKYLMRSRTLWNGCCIAAHMAIILWAIFAISKVWNAFYLVIHIVNIVLLIQICANDRLTSGYRAFWLSFMILIPIFSPFSLPSAFLSAVTNKKEHAMKKKLNSLIAVALCALATCFVLVGCSPCTACWRTIGRWTRRTCSTIPPSTAARMKTTSTGTSHRGRQPTRSAPTTALLR